MGEKLKFSTQLGLLLWKNFSLRKRQPLRIVAEVVLPLVLFIILAWVKLDRGLQTYKHECHFDGKTMPSAGTIPFLQSYLCTANNTCHEKPVDSELPGVVQNFNTSVLSQFVFELEELLSNQSELNAIVNILEDLNTFQHLGNKAANGSLNCTFRIRDVILNSQELQDQITSQNISLDQTAVQEILNSSLNASEVLLIYNEVLSLLADPIAYQQRLQELLNQMYPGVFNLSAPALDSVGLASLGIAEGVIAWLESNNNTNDLVQDVANNLGASQAVVLVTAEVRDRLCTDKKHEYLIIFEDPTLGVRALDELCNLTFTEFEELVNDIWLDSANGFLVLQQLNECSNQYGRDIRYDESSYNTQARMLEDILELESLYDLRRQLDATSEEGAKALQDLQNPNKALKGFNLLVCGRENSVLQSVDETEQGVRAIRQQAGAEDSEQPEDEHGYKYDNSTTPFCNSIFSDLEKTTSGRIMWKQLKPLIRGKIPYTPDTPAVRALLKEANATFEYLGLIKQLARDWLMISPDVADFLENDPRVELFRTLLTSADDFATFQLNVIGTDGSLSDGVRQIINDTQRLLGYDEQIPDEQFLEEAQATIRDLRSWLSNDITANVTTWRTTLNYTTEIFELTQKYLECVELDKFEPFKDEEKLVETGLHYIEDYKLWAGLVFDMDEHQRDSKLPAHIEYKIRMSVDMVDTTAGYRVTDRYWTPGPRARPLPDMKYIVYGFSYIQDMVEHAIIRLRTNLTEEIGISVQQFPYPCYIYDVFSMAISRSMPMFMVLAWIYSVAMIVKSIVYEKERRLKEVMKMMGLGNSVHWTAWFITSFIMMFITIILLVIVLKVGKILEHSDPSVIIFFLMVFTISTIVFCFMISVFFARANLAAVCAGVFYFTSYLPYTFCARWEEYMTVGQKALTSIFNTVAFGWGCNYFSLFEEQGVGIQWHNINSSPMPDDGYSMLGCILMLMLDTILYGLITWYVEAVFPGEYGMPKPWYFLFTKSYWLGNESNTDDIGIDSPSIELSQQHPDKYEAEPTHLKKGVCVQNLKKVYKRGKKVAVDGLSINFYENQITSFLGHNGAGKTTTMSILTGLFPPTEGTAYVYNQDIRTDMHRIRKSLGMCPQHNVLFDQLTVEEHIWFYGRLKGMDKVSVKREITQMIQDTGLQRKQLDRAANLSGGQKRKLSVAIAFVADSKVVILDEPTAGVDPYARRSIWELLLKYKKGRTIILSTHFMDEADILGDRIAIISHGKLCCCGSSLFLKSNLGNGYYLTLVKKDEDAASDAARSKANDTTKLSDVKLEMDRGDKAWEDEKSAANDTMDDTASSSDASAFDDSMLTAFVKKHIPEAVLTEHFGAELTYQLPDDKHTLSHFEIMFDDLDQNLNHLGISSYGISDTTLEEVFLKVAEDMGVDEELPEESRRQRMEQVTEGGQFARPVTRMSFRKGVKGFFGLGKKKKDERCLMDSVDTYSESGGENQLDLDAIAEVENCNGAGSYRIQGVMLVFRQFYAMFIKRLHYLLRSKKGFFAQIFLPAIFICLAQLFAKIVPITPVEPAMEVHPWLLSPLNMDDSHMYTFFSNDDPHLQWTQKVASLLQEKPEIGNRCMDPKAHEIKDHPCKSVNSEQSKWTHQKARSDFKRCSCETGIQVCPEGAGGAEPPKRLLHTTDYLYNMTDRDIRTWLVKTHDDYIKKRYGGLSLGERNDLVLVNSTQIENAFDRILRAANGQEDHNVTIDIPPFVQDVETLLENFATKQNAKIWFNNKGYVSMVSYMNAMNNLLLRAHLPEGSDLRDHGITLVNHPMNRTRFQLAAHTIESSWVDVLIAIAVIFAMSCIPASFVLFLISERVSGAKHLHLVSGVNPTVYWITNFCWDMLNYILACILCVIIFVAFQVDAYVSAANLPCLVCLLAFYGWSIIPLMYPASFFFNVPSTAFVAVQCANLFIGFISTIATFILEMLALGGDEELYDINAILRQVFLIFPQYCLGRGLIDMTRNQIIADAFKIFGEDYFENPFKWDIVGRNLFALFMQGIIYFIITLAIEYKFWRHKIPCLKTEAEREEYRVIEDEDVDVARERKRVMTGDTHADVLTIQALSKVYKSTFNRGGNRAVDKICVGIHKGECFGLLGVNGAGKTSTFKMLTGDEHVTSGDAHLDGHSVLTEMVKVHQNLGYCPQFDALCGLLTGREHLELYARLRGVPEHEVRKVASWGIKKLGLIKYSTKLAGDYSGGNKRKLSTAIALVGNPPVVFLDEPTTGMDPKARRFLWNSIMDILRDGRSVVLTSHSMEECEALCGRIAIMVNGRFECMGSIQHLKNRFGDGYTVILRVSGETPDLESVITFFSSTFPESQLREKHHNMVQYQISASYCTLAKIFGEMEKVREELRIEDYSVSQTTLDQVFINFAMLQNSDGDRDSHGTHRSPCRDEPNYMRLNGAGHQRDEHIGVGYRSGSNFVTLEKLDENDTNSAGYDASIA